ncbi:MAG: SPOR domain-containing protein [Bacteroidales bacterium]|nr:SPOR domain-containing protein [Bacteroidales bacterium]
MRQTKRLYISIFYIICAFSASSQVSELHLSELSNCTPEKNKDIINTIEQSYKEVAILYNDASNNSLSDQAKIEKVASLFKIQVSVKDKLQEIWQQSDSISRDNSKKYFEEASRAFKELTDTINLINPEFKSIIRALIIVEKSHQVILLQKFGIQVLFGCLKESSGRLNQPTDISNDIVINIDMIERFRKVWNESNYPMTYDQWEYKPSERKTFSNRYYANSWKDYRFGAKKDTASIDLSKSTTEPQNTLANNILGSQKDILNPSKDQLNSSNNSFADTKDSRFAGKNLNNQQSNQTFTIKGEGKKLGINRDTQYEIKNLTTQSKIKALGVEYFTIQIAASRNQLIIERLKNDFNCGRFDIEEKNESGWYKYLVGHFASIDSANKYLSKPCMVRGFVSGYNSKGRVAIFSIKQPITATGSSSSMYSIVYRVQVAASKEPLSIELISKIYSGANPVNVSKEDGWYRYSIGDFFYYDEAKLARDSSNVKNAFVMPYQNGKRIQWPGKEALELMKLNQKEKALYVIQIAASRKPLPFKIIKSVIKVEYPLTMKFEDGWYKYFISAFTDFAYAKQVAEKIGIKGTFIATYKNGLRVNP